MPKVIGAMLSLRDPSATDISPNFVTQVLQDSCSLWLGPPVPVSTAPLGNRHEHLNIDKHFKKERAKAQFKKFYRDFFAALQRRICGGPTGPIQALSIGSLGSAM